MSGVTLAGSVQHEAATSIVLRLAISGLPEGAILHVDDSTDGSFAGADPECRRCRNRVGYLHCDVPDTMEEAYAAAFIPCVEVQDDADGIGAWNSLYCVSCALKGVFSKEDEDG